MRIRRPPARLTPNAVTVNRVAFAGRDQAGGRSFTETPLPVTYRVSVHPTDADDVPEHLREAEVVYLTVKFYDDPQLRIRDEVLDDLGRTLVVAGVKARSGGYETTWQVLCAYRPVPGRV